MKINRLVISTDVYCACMRVCLTTHTGSRAPRPPPDQLCCSHSACVWEKTVKESADHMEGVKHLKNTPSYKNLNAAANVVVYDKSLKKRSTAAEACSQTR